MIYLCSFSEQGNGGNMKKILLLTTGGTIASEKGEEGLEPSLRSNDIINIIGTAQYSEIVCEDLLSLDSSNIQPEEWLLIGKRIQKAVVQKECDGIVITHGTDTMAYTASALSFMLSNLPIPVVLCGSQLPLTHPLSDGVDNIRLAFFAASQVCLHGVFIAFHHCLMLGTRCVKVRTMGFDAFESVNVNPVGVLDARGLTIDQTLLPTISGAFHFYDQLCTDVFLLKLIPGMNPNILDILIEQNYKGIVIEAFGAGGIHFIRRDLIAKLDKLVQNGISVVVCSQCLYENSDFSIYQSGQKVLKQGVIQAYDMTSEACVTKLMWALGQQFDTEEIRYMFSTNYVQEITLSK